MLFFKKEKFKEKYLNFITKEDKENLKYMMPYLMKNLRQLLLIEGNILLSIVVAALHPILWGKIVIQIFDQNKRAFIFYVCCFFVLLILRNLLNLSERFLTERIKLKMARCLKSDISKKLIDLSLSKYYTYEPAELIARIENDSSLVVNTLLNYLFQVSNNLFRLVIIGCIMLYMNLFFAVLILVGTPISALLIMKFGKKIRLANREFLKVRDKYSSITQQIVYGHTEIKNLAIKDKIAQIFNRQLELLYRSELRLKFLNAITTTLGRLFNFIVEIMIVVIGGFMIFEEIISFDYYLAFSTYAHYFTNSYHDLINHNLNLQRVLESLKRVNELLLNKDDDNSLYGNMEIQLIKGTITFENVSFAYSEKNVLNGINVKINSSSFVGLVGHNGSGKTTLVKLLMGLYKCDSGMVKIDNINIKDINELSLRNYLGSVLQNSYLFNCSIRENLTMVKSEITEEELVDICRLVELDNFVDSLPQGYDTIIGENGSYLSGGQRQKLILARCLVRGCKILIFDEAVSALDIETKNIVYNLLRKLKKNHTIIFVTHDPMIMHEFDEVIFLKDGEIEAKGKHYNLKKCNSEYMKIFEEK